MVPPRNTFGWLFGSPFDPLREAPFSAHPTRSAGTYNGFTEGPARKVPLMADPGQAAVLANHRSLRQQ
jgi:hypothetical protein